MKTPVTNYRQLLALAKANPGRVSLVNDPHEALRASAYAFGVTTGALETAADVLRADARLKPYKQAIKFVGAELGEDSPWLDGSLIAGQAFNGDIAYLRDTYNAPLAFAIPSPGCMIWQEQLALHISAPHVEAAYRFIAAITSAAYAVRNSQDVHYAPANPMAFVGLDKKFREDPVIRPTLDGLENCYLYKPYGDEARAALDKVRL